MTRPVRIGCGAGFAGDRLEPALELVERAAIDFLMLECLAERTIAIAQKERLADPARGFCGMLLRRMEMLMPALSARGVRTQQIRLSDAPKIGALRHRRGAF